MQGTSALSTGDAIKAILGLVVLLGLAYAAGHPVVQRLEQRLRISQVVTAGFPFVILGLVARSHAVGVLSDPVLAAIRPLFPLGLGWLGFAVGFRFDLRRFEDAPRDLTRAFALTTVVPFAAIVLAAGAVIALTEGVSADAFFVRDALLLATAGAMTSRTVPAILLRRRAEPVVVDRIATIIQLEELVAFIALLAVAAFFRPDPPVAGWELPGFGWVFVSLGVGSALGFIIFALLRAVGVGTETIVVMLGSIALASGLAATLRLSPLVVCFIAGALLASFAGDWKDRVKAAIARLERPVYLLFLIIAGALWRVDAWEGWVLMVLFVVARLAGRWAGVKLFLRNRTQTMSPTEQRSLVASPMGSLAIAVVVSAQDLYSGATLPWTVTAILAGSIATEVVVQVIAFRGPRPPSEGTIVAMRAAPIVADLPEPIEEGGARVPAPRTITRTDRMGPLP